jgi:hypothetical protein
MFGTEYNIFSGTDCDLSGLKIAQVISNIDPTGQEKVFVRVIGVHDMSSIDSDYSIPCLNCAPSQFSSGEIPDIGSWVYVMFPDINNPAYCVRMGFVRFSEGY